MYLPNAENDFSDIRITDDKGNVIIDNGNQGEITLRLDHGKLRGVRFGSFKGFWASSEDAFSYYGEPDYVLGHYLSGVFGGSSIFFCYTKQGVMLKSEFKMLNDQPSQNYPLTEKTKIVEILYYDVDNIPWSYNVYPCLKPTSKDYVSTDWHGYGEYSTCDPEEHNWCDR